jgi:hypothetical protein
VRKHAQISTISLVIFGLVALIPLLHAVPASAAPQSPYKCGILGDVPNAEKLLNCADYRNSGSLPAFLDVGQETLGTVGEITYSDFTCLRSKIVDQGMTPEEAFETLGLEMNSGPGFAGMVILATSDLLQARPVSGIVFALDQVDKLVAPDAVFAQTTTAPQQYFPGTGFALLAPIQGFWGWAATMSFSFMTLIIIIVAFAMIFRSRLGGKEVVQIQNAIPGIVLAMILIPLSYPLSGLFIDGITVTTNLFHDFILGPAGPGASIYQNDVKGSDGQPFNSGRGLYGDDWRVSSLRVREQFGAQAIASGFAQSFCASNTANATANCDSVNFNQFNLIDSVVSAFEGNPGLAQLLGNLLNLIFNLIAIVVSIKITWRLLKKFVNMVFLPITSPFIFATVAIPGQGTKAVIDYFKQLLNASLHFVVTYCLFLIVIVFANPAFHATITDPAGSAGYRPPVLSGVLTSIVVPSGGISSSLIFTVLALGLFLAIPSILDQIDDKFKTGPMPFAKEILGELRSSSDIAFRQAPAVIGAAGRNIAGGLTRYRDTFRPAGTPTAREAAQARGAAALASAEAALADAQASTGLDRGIRIAAANANLARVRAANNLLPGRENPPGEEAQKVNVLYELFSNEVSIIKLDAAFLRFAAASPIKLTIKLKSTRYPLPREDILMGDADNFGGSKKVIPTKGETGVLRSLLDSSKTKPDANKTDFSIPAELDLTSIITELTAMGPGEKLDPKPKKVFAFGGVRSSKIELALQRVTKI